MLFKDHLKIVTDAGAVLHLGWDYDAPYFLDPLNGVDVDLQTAQGVNQIGDTVEGSERLRRVPHPVGRVLGQGCVDPCKSFYQKAALLHQRHPLFWRPLFHPLRAAKIALFFQLHAGPAL